jgi:hypothetical protein
MPALNLTMLAAFLGPAFTAISAQIDFRELLSVTFNTLKTDHSFNGLLTAYRADISTIVKSAPAAFLAGTALDLLISFAGHATQMPAGAHAHTFALAAPPANLPPEPWTPESLNAWAEQHAPAE